jgi:hypothetical protein
MALRQHVGIEHELFRLIQRTFPARENRILFPLFVAGVIEIAFTFVGNRHVRLGDARFNFFEDLLLQWLGMSHDTIGILVFGFQVSDDFGIIPIF